MSILLRLSNSKVAQTMFGQDISQDVGQIMRRKGHGQIKPLVVLGETDVMHPGKFGSLKAGEVLASEAAGDLACTVRPEVEEDDRVPILDATDILAIQVNQNDGLHKLVHHLLLIRPPNSGSGVFGPIALSLHHGSIGPLESIPAFVPVHGIIAPHDGGDLSYPYLVRNLQQFIQITFPAGRGSIPSVQEEMEADLR
jgi:hypothetical protein